MELTIFNFKSVISYYDKHLILSLLSRVMMLVSFR